MKLDLHNDILARYGNPRKPLYVNDIVFTDIDGEDSIQIQFSETRKAGYLKYSKLELAQVVKKMMTPGREIFRFAVMQVDNEDEHNPVKSTTEDTRLQIDAF